MIGYRNLSIPIKLDNIKISSQIRSRLDWSILYSIDWMIKCTAKYWKWLPIMSTDWSRNNQHMH